MKIIFETFVIENKQIIPISLCTSEGRVDLDSTFISEKDVVEAIEKANFIYYKKPRLNQSDYFPIEGNKIIILKTCIL